MLIEDLIGPNRSGRTFSSHAFALDEKNVTSGSTTVTKRFYANGLHVAKMVGATVCYLHQDALGGMRAMATTDTATGSPERSSRTYR